MERVVLYREATEVKIEGVGFGEIQEWVEDAEQEAWSDTWIAYSPRQEAICLIVEREREIWRLWGYVGLSILRRKEEEGEFEAINFI